MFARDVEDDLIASEFDEVGLDGFAVGVRPRAGVRAEEEETGEREGGADLLGFHGRVSRDSDKIFGKIGGIREDFFCDKIWEIWVVRNGE